MISLSANQSCLLKLNTLLTARPGIFLDLLRLFGPDDLFKTPAAAIDVADYHPAEEIEAILRRAGRVDAQAEAERAERSGVSLLFYGEPGYPETLQATEDAPLVLYVKGKLRLEADCVAFVGSRYPTAYGRRMAGRLCADAAAAGYCVVSGLARGIDTEAHQAALRAEGLTWAVLGCGLSRVYPAENAALAENIVQSGGAIISEYPMNCAPLPHHFPRRNRIVSGLSWATVVIEGRIKSGSLITAKAALRQGRPVLAVPGPADSPLCEAPHHLLSRGAALAVRLADVVAELPPSAQRPGSGLYIRNGGLGPHAGPELSPEHQKILQSLGSDSLTLEELGHSTGLDFLRLSTIIFELEMQDLVDPLPGQRYAKKGN